MTYEHQISYFQTINIWRFKLLNSPQSSGHRGCGVHVDPWLPVPRTRVDRKSAQTRGYCGCCGHVKTCQACLSWHPLSPWKSRVCLTSLPPPQYFYFRILCCACDCCCVAGNESFDSRMSFLSLKKFLIVFSLKRNKVGFLLQKSWSWLMILYFLSCVKNIVPLKANTNLHRF